MGQRTNDIKLDAVLCRSCAVRIGGATLSSLLRAAANAALRDANGNREEAARILGVGTRTLYRWLKDGPPGGCHDRH